MQCTECDAQKAPENLYCSSCGRPFDWSAIPAAPVCEAHTPIEPGEGVGAAPTVDAASDESTLPSRDDECVTVDGTRDPCAGSDAGNVSVGEVSSATVSCAEGKTTTDQLLEAIAALEADPLLASIDAASPPSGGDLPSVEPSLIDVLSLEVQPTPDVSLPQPWWTPRSESDQERPVRSLAMNDAAMAQVTMIPAGGAPAAEQVAGNRPPAPTPASSAAATGAETRTPLATTSPTPFPAPPPMLAAPSTTFVASRSAMGLTASPGRVPEAVTASATTRTSAAPSWRQSQPGPSNARRASHVLMRPRLAAIKPTTRQGFLVAAGVAILIGTPYAAWQWRAYPASGILPQEPLASRALVTMFAPTLPSSPDPSRVQASAAPALVVPVAPPTMVPVTTPARKAAAVVNTASAGKAQRTPPTKKGRVSNTTAVREAARPEPAREAIAAAAVPVAVAPLAAPPPPSPVVDAVSPAPEPVGRQAFEATQVDVRPEVARRVAPRYPEALKDRAFEDVVIVRVLVSSTGSARDARVLRRSRVDAALDDAALAAVRQWTFAPARKRDQAVNCWMTVGVPFSRGRVDGTQ